MASSSTDRRDMQHHTDPGVEGEEGARVYVLDTSVLLADPMAMTRFAEHQVVIPVVVITELESKRHHPELGYFARNALRRLDSLRVANGRLDLPVPVNEQGGTLRVELNHSDPEVLPAGFRLGDNDTRILTVARNLQLGKEDNGEAGGVVLVSKDLPMRIKASSIGLEADEYRAELAIEHGWTGMAELDVPAHNVDELFESGSGDIEEARDLPCHTGLVLVSDRSKALGRVQPDKSVRLVCGDREVFGLHGRSADSAWPSTCSPTKRWASSPRRTGRYGQVRAGAVRRAESGHGTSQPPQGRGVSSHVRRRWPGTGLPAAPSTKMNRGAKRCTTPCPVTSEEVVEEIIDRGCWRSFHSPTSEDAHCTMRS